MLSTTVTPSNEPSVPYPLNPPLDFATLPGESKQLAPRPLQDDSGRSARRQGRPASPDTIPGNSGASGNRPERPRERRHPANWRRGNYQNSNSIGNETLCLWHPIRAFLVRPQMSHWLERSFLVSTASEQVVAVSNFANRHLSSDALVKAKQCRSQNECPFIRQVMKTHAANVGSASSIPVLQVPLGRR